MEEYMYTISFWRYGTVFDGLPSNYCMSQNQCQVALRTKLICERNTLTPLFVRALLLLLHFICCFFSGHVWKLVIYWVMWTRWSLIIAFWALKQFPENDRKKASTSQKWFSPDMIEHFLLYCLSPPHTLPTRFSLPILLLYKWTLWVPFGSFTWIIMSFRVIAVSSDPHMSHLSTRRLFRHQSICHINIQKACKESSDILSLWQLHS